MFFTKNSTDKRQTLFWGLDTSCIPGQFLRPNHLMINWYLNKPDPFIIFVFVAFSFLLHTQFNKLTFVRDSFEVIYGEMISGCSTSGTTFFWQLMTSFRHQMRRLYGLWRDTPVVEVHARKPTSPWQPLPRITQNTEIWKEQFCQPRLYKSRASVYWLHS